ncbi:MAG: hypothetical protein KGK08_05320 [Acidobacteriota bacterium]|nr:hypothetical protein [Acidobacteriota bacterium]
MHKYSRRQMLESLALAGAAPALWPQLVAAESTVATAPLPAADRRKLAEPLVAYFQQNAPKLLRPAQGPFRFPTLAPSLPGKQYSAELWDWDTLWTCRGLFRLAAVTGDAAFKAQVAEHARGSLLVFFDHQTPEGRIPLVLKATNPRVGTLQRLVPNYQNQAKPVFGQLARMICEETGAYAWVDPLFAKLLRFYDSWSIGNETGAGLLVWGDDVSIGNDNDPTTFGRPFFSSANLLLNCLYYQDLRAAAEIATRLNRPADEQQRLADRIARLGAAIQRECWDPRDAFYYTVDVQCVDRRAELIPDVARGMAMAWQTIPLRFQVFTGFLPLWCGLATPAQAKTLLERNYFADDRLRANFGVRSLSRLETMYSMDFSSNPSNWLGPVWIIVNYFVWQALARYGYTSAADDLAARTVRLLAADLQANGSLNEYYHPDTGAALSHKGFMDWNMLVLEMI